MQFNKIGILFCSACAVISPRGYSGDTPSFDLNVPNFTINSNEFYVENIGEDVHLVINVVADGSVVNYHEYLTLTDNSTNFKIYSSTNPRHSYIKNEVYTLEYNIPTYFLDYFGNTINFEIISAALNTVYSLEIIYYGKYVDQKFNPFIDDNYNHPVGFQVINNEIKYTYDVIDFSETNDYFTCDQYYRLTFQNLSPKHYGKEKIQGNAWLIITNPTSCFDLLDKREDGNIYIPLTYVEDEEHNVNLSLRINMYVEPKSLKMHFKVKPYSYETRFFYMPRNAKKEVSKNTFEIMFENVGPLNLTLRYPVEYNIKNNLIGDCYDSDYCLNGGVFA